MCVCERESQLRTPAKGWGGRDLAVKFVPWHEKKANNSLQTQQLKYEILPSKTEWEKSEKNLKIVCLIFPKR